MVAACHWWLLLVVVFCIIVGLLLLYTVVDFVASYACGMSCDTFRHQGSDTRLVERKRRSNRRVKTWHEILKTQFSGSVPGIQISWHDIPKTQFSGFVPEPKTEF